MKSLLAGASTRTITPAIGPLPVFLAGFQGNRRATGIDRELYVRTLAIAEPNGRPFVLAVCDLIGLLRVDTLKIRAAVADLHADIVVASTHTHSGPDTIGLWGADQETRGVNDEHLATIRDAIAASIREAVAVMEPAQLRVVYTRVDGVVQNLRDPEILDDGLGALSFEREDGSTIATLINLGVHPEVLSGESLLVSSDIAGATCIGVEAVRGGIAIWVSGDLGGMQAPAPGPRTLDELERKTALVVNEVCRTLSQAPVVVQPIVRFTTSRVQLPLWNPRYRAGIGAGLLKGEINADGTIVTEISVLDLGAARAACWPGEVLPKLGLRSKEALNTPVPLLFGLANDELGYLLPDEDFVPPTDWEKPGRSYEESMSVGPDVGSRLFSALQEASSRLAR